MSLTTNDLKIEIADGIATVEINRPKKRNAINDALIEALGSFFASPPDDVGVAILHGAGDHFCAGLDLSEHRERGPIAVMHHSRMWHRHLDSLQFGRIPIISVLKNAVVGGGLEIASATHVRVSERSAFYALPEAQRGIYVGGGASVRLTRIIGAGRMAEMMLTGRSYDAEDGYRMGVSHHLVEPGQGLAKARSLAAAIAKNAPLSNYAIINALPRIAEMSPSDGLFAELLTAAIVQTGAEAAAGLSAFLEGRGQKAGADRKILTDKTHAD